MHSPQTSEAVLCKEVSEFFNIKLMQCLLPPLHSLQQLTTGDAKQAQFVRFPAEKLYRVKSLNSKGKNYRRQQKTPTSINTNKLQNNNRLFHPPDPPQFTT